MDSYHFNSSKSISIRASILCKYFFFCLFYFFHIDRSIIVFFVYLCWYFDLHVVCAHKITRFVFVRLLRRQIWKFKNFAWQLIADGAGRGVWKREGRKLERDRKSLELTISDNWRSGINWQRRRRRHIGFLLHVTFDSFRVPGGFSAGIFACSRLPVRLLPNSVRS